MRRLLTYAPVFLAGLIIGAWALSSAPQRRDVPSDNTARLDARDFDRNGEYERLEQMIDSLTEIVSYEVAERRRLEANLERLAGTVGELADSGGDDADAADARAERVAAATAASEPGSQRPNRIRGQRNSEERFIEAGFAPEQAAALKRRLDEIEMERLYLRDQAVREGWLGSARYRDELRALTQRQNSVRNDLDPDEYDRFLYATGRPNRVNVNSVLSGSPADQSGMRTGDQILSYDGQRVFSPADIRRETTRGERGTLVPVEVLREGRTEIIYLPRGPLGVQMGSMVTRP